jgi:hypothetical protein
MEKTWEQMSVDEKQEAQFQKLLTPKDHEGNDLPFQSQAAKDKYTANINRLKHAVQLKKSPDRVPVTLFPNMFPYRYAGMTVQEAMYDYEKCVAGYKKFVLDFEPDFPMGAAGPGPGRVYEILDYRLYSWPGHGVAPEHSYQCNEAEYMKAEEYDLLITDPSFYFRNFYLPRVFGKLTPWSMLPPLTGILEIYGVAFNFIPFGLPPVQDAYKALFEAGAEALKWAGAVGGVDAELASLGFPSIFGGFSKAPYDVLGDTLRGSKGIIMDMYRQPDKLLKALEALTPIMIGLGLGAAQQTGKPFIFMPLHKGADGFLSDEQFRRFYWPTLKAVIQGLIDGGCIPLPAAEGCYNTRLKYLSELPAGKSIWMFDRTDMEKAKGVVGDTLCLLGNVPSSMLKLGSPEDVRDYARNLIDTAGKDGGFILCNGAFFDEAVPENVKAMVDFTKEYGVYK